MLAWDRPSQKPTWPGASDFSLICQVEIKISTLQSNEDKPMRHVIQLMFNSWTQIFSLSQSQLLQQRGQTFQSHVVMTVIVQSVSHMEVLLPTPMFPKPKGKKMQEQMGIMGKSSCSLVISQSWGCDTQRKRQGLSVLVPGSLPHQK